MTSAAGPDDRLVRLARAAARLSALSSDAFRLRQTQRVRRIVSYHLRAPHPGYARLVQSSDNRVDKGGTLGDLSDLEALPVVDKRFLSANRYDTRPACISETRTVSTSGTTSSVVLVPHTVPSLVAGLGDNYLRALIAGGYGGGYRHWGVGHWLDEERLTGSLISFRWLEHVLPDSSLVTHTGDDLISQVSAALRFGAQTVSSSPGFLARLALEPSARKLSIPAVLYGGGAMAAETKESLVEVVGARDFIAFYPTTDAGALGVSPRDDGIYQCFFETHHVEVIDLNGRHVNVGDEGDIVVTNLLNRAAPLIRYRTGDRVRYEGTESNRVLISGIRRLGEATLGSTLIPFSDLGHWTSSIRSIDSSVLAVQLVRRRSSGRDVPVLRVIGSGVRAPVVADAVTALLLEHEQVRHEVRAGELHPPIVEFVEADDVGDASWRTWKYPSYLDEAEESDG